MEAVDHVIELKPDACMHCQGPLKQRRGGPQLERHQQVELPPLTAEVTEYQLTSQYCAACDAWTTAGLPTGVPPHGFGVRLTALVALLTGRYRLSKRAVKALLRDVTGVELAVGSVCNLERRVSAALEAPVEEALQFVRRQGVVHQDETSWREGRRLTWLWVTLTALVTVFHIRKRRATEVSKSILGPDFGGYLVSDRHNLYFWRDIRLRQLCWSHILRDFERMVEFGAPPDKRTGRALLRQGTRLFRLWRRMRDGLMQRSRYLRSMKDVRRKIRHHLLRANGRGRASLAKRLLKIEPALWTFLHVDGLEPTNNPAERAVRHAVIWRKTSFGTFGPRGTLFVERILTTVASLQQQGRGVLDFLVEAYASYLHGTPPPSLLPVSRA